MPDPHSSSWRDALRKAATQPTDVRTWRERFARLPVDGAAAVAEAFHALVAVPQAWLLSPLVLDRLAQGWIESGDQASLDSATLAEMAHWCRSQPADSAARMSLLRLLAIDGSASALNWLAELLNDEPPLEEPAFLMVLVPLVQRRSNRPWAPAALFPRIFDCAAYYPQGSAALFDLANLATRKGLVPHHPAAGQFDQLLALLGTAVSHLGQIEEQPKLYATTPQELYETVARGVAIVVTLCDTLALIGRIEAAPKLHQAAQLAHRRIRTEAAAALARLGDEAGLEMLAGLACEPVVRSRALAYLEELSTDDGPCIERVDPRFRSPEARAEGELAVWLASPTQYGMAPNRLELFDHRTQYWPGHAHPVECYLFRFEYRMGEAVLAGVGIAGPLTFALRADLQDRPAADIYAIYAGWHAQHPEIVEVPPEQLDEAAVAAWQQVQAELIDRGFDDVELYRAGHFFGESHFVATAEQAGQSGVVVVAGGSLHWYPLPAQRRRPLGAAEVYNLHKGRLLLRAFNRSGS